MSNNNTDYKSTLNLPRTDFPMKADLPKREPAFLKKWQEMDIYRNIREKSQGKPKYILHDGPPYANGDIHIGHALNKTLKDIIVRYKGMRGFDSPFVPGWDCHGLPVEHQLFKELKINKSQVSQIEFRKKAHNYALRYVNVQREQFIRLGIFGDWQNSYLTLNPDYEASILSAFSQLFKGGFIYRGLKPVNWCFKCETALAEAEVEYEVHTSPSIVVKFKLDENNPPHQLFQKNNEETNWCGGKDYLKDTYLLIWTTTPWTLIANVAVAMNPEFTYSYIKTEKGNLILAKALLAEVLSKAGIDRYELIKEIKGSILEGLIYTHPFGLRKGRIVPADYISKEEGTGLVHTAPGHGNEDYITGLKYKLEMVMPVDARGKFDSTAAEFRGLNVFDANDVIIERLKESGALFFNTQLQHSYPHCWRCKTPIIFRATKQWFLNVVHDNLRERLIEAIDKDVQWIPASGKERIRAMVELRPDWCLSRQRFWGVPIPALMCNECNEEFLVHKVIDKFSEFVAREGSDSWFVRDIKDFLADDIQCPNCKGSKFSKGSDILDVWFDSGVSHQAVLKKREDLGFPCALYLEGSDQHRGWFQSSLIPSMCIDGVPPFKKVLTHGFVVDGQGRKMSKSAGNVISPQDIIQEYGADILRLWVASSDYNEDIRISKEILSRLCEAYRKIRNTARFILSNLYDFNPDRDTVPYENLKRIDKWILLELETVLLAEVEKAYESFEFHKAYKNIYDFCNEELSMSYLDMVKGRLYTYHYASIERRAAQTAIFEVLNTLVRVMAPIFVFTAEEIWQDMPKRKADRDVSCVHLLDWPKSKIEEWGKKNIEEITNLALYILGLRPEVDKVLEDIRSQGQIGSSFDAKIKLLTKSEERYKFLTSFKSDLCELFKVSQVEIERTDDLGADLVKSENVPDIAIAAAKADGSKCARCWNYHQSAGGDKRHPLICDNCLKAIGGR